MIVDSHIHSIMSPDGKVTPEDAIAAASSQGLGVTFTEHIDYISPPFSPMWRIQFPYQYKDFVTNLDIYPDIYYPYRSDTALLGLEIGLSAGFIEKNMKAAERAIDCIIGAVHFVDGWDLGGPYYDQPYDDHYRRYLQFIREMVEEPLNGYFNTLGHIDYLSRYSPLAIKEVLYKDYPDEYDAVLRALVRLDKAMEINTRRFGDVDAVSNLCEIYRRYRTLGGRYVTIGSDAHAKDRIGKHFKEALRMAAELGLTAVYFKDRKMKS